MELLEKSLTGQILGCAFDVHAALGPGLLEAAYQTCLGYELQSAGLTIRREVPLKLRYKGRELDCGYRADLIVEDRVLVELKTVERLAPIHKAQLMTYLKLSGLRVGLLINFNSIHLRSGIQRIVI